VKSLGADTVIDYTKEDFTKTGQRYDFILNAVGKRKAQLQCENSLTPNGKHITVDDDYPKAQFEYLILLKQLAETGQIKPVIDRRYRLEQMWRRTHMSNSGIKRATSSSRYKMQMYLLRAEVC